MVVNGGRQIYVYFLLQSELCHEVHMLLDDFQGKMCFNMCNFSHFYTRQQAANLAVLFAARSVDLDRRW